MSYEGPVRKSKELERVLALPRRVLDFESPEVVQLAWAWSRQLLNDDGQREWDRIVALPDEERDYEFARFARPKNEFVDGLPGVGCPLLLLPEQAIMLFEAFHCKGMFASAGVGIGKALAHGEIVMTPRGFVRIEDIKVGDSVIGSDGESTRVLGVYPQGMRDVWRVRFSDGVSVRCDGSHLWTFRGSKKTHTRTTEEWSRERMTRPCGDHKAHRLFAPMLSAPVQMAQAELPLDAYTLGALLGDGGITQPVVYFTTMDTEIRDRLRLPEGVEYSDTGSDRAGLARTYTLRKKARRSGSSPNPLIRILRKLNLIGKSSHDKFVPPMYLCASVEQRLDLLRGLCDTDGSVCSAGVEYGTMSQRLAEAVVYLAQTLGGTASYRKTSGNFYRLYLRLPEGLTPFYLSRKRIAYESKRRQAPPTRAVVSITRDGSAECTCIQVAAEDGLFATTGCVLTHNTLVNLLLALIFGAERPLVIVPGSLEEDTHAKFADLVRYWKAPRPMPQVITYEKLSNPQHALLLCDCAKCAGAKEEPAEPGGIRPTHLFPDESDKLRNPEAAVTRRIGRYMSRHSDTIYCGMTGTAWRKSIKNSAPQIIWALKWQAPVPVSWVDLQEWSEALDLSSRGERRDPGALLLLAGAEPDKVHGYAARVELAAEGFQRRLLETPGVIQTHRQSCETPLTIRFLKAPDDPILDAAFYQFRETSATLDGWDIDDPLSAMRYATEMSVGFFYFWSPRPPQEWLEARSAASKRVREYIKDSRTRGRPLDTKAQVYRLYPDDPTLVAWKVIEPTFVPNTVARPITASVLGYAAAWLRANGPALVWVQHDYAGSALSAMTGVPFFGSKGRDASGRYIMKHSPKESAILSLRANMRGRNLQAWRNNLIVGPTAAATEWEQGYCGRTHRQGQKHPVHIDVLLACAENLHAVTQARAEQEWVRSRGGATGKLLCATYDWSQFPAVELERLPLEHPSRARWARA